jgi:hypothetical protein
VRISEDAAEDVSLPPQGFQHASMAKKSATRAASGSRVHQRRRGRLWKYQT